MRRIVAAMCAGLVVLAACGGDDGGVSSADGDDRPAATTTSTEAPDTAETTTVAAVSVAATVAPTAPPTTPAPTAAPTTPAPTAPATPAPTAPPTTAKPAPTTTAPLVSFAQFSVDASTCPAPDVSIPTDPQVVVKWKLAGVIPDDVYTAVDNPDGPYESGLPTQGTATFSRACDGSQHTYYVVAVVGSQKFVKSKKVS